MKTTLSVLFLFLSGALATAQDADGVFEFLKLPISTRAEALGGDNVSVVEKDLSLVFHNPAFLGQEMDMDLNLGFNSYLGGIKAGNVAFAKSMGLRSAWGIGINFVDYGTLKETTIDDQVLGEISAKDLCINGFFSRDLSDRWRGGVSAKVIYSVLEQYTSVGLAADVGLSYYDDEKDFAFGLVGKNLGAQVKAYNDNYESLPWDIRLGMTKRLAHAPIRFSLTALHLTQWEFDPVTEGNTDKDSFFTTFFKHMIFGVEFLPSENFWIALGYNPKLGSDMKLETGNKMGGFSMGTGIRVKAFNIGVSLSQFHPSGTSFHLNVTTSLSELNL